jgi:hypothetical protein
LFDSLGRVVRTQSVSVIGPGAARVRWDGRSATGGPLAAGVYFYRIEGPRGLVAQGKITTIR